MNPSLQTRATEVYLAACALPAGEQAAYINETCGPDHELRAAVETLLAKRNQAAETLPATPTDPTVNDFAQSPSSSGTEHDKHERIFEAGTQIAKRYRIVSLLGRGGMGEVYRAEDMLLGGTVALKFLRRALVGNREWLERLTREVQTARAVTHPNICRVHDIHIDDQTGETFISMAYIEGEDLRTLLRRIGRLPQAKAIEISRQLCVGLTAAHAHGVLHRDLKPANIMIDDDGQVCITDFGLAATREQITASEIRAGTPAYMAPELFAGTDVSVKSDIYALGLLVYELFSGRPAFTSDSYEQIAHAHQRLTPPTLSSIAPDTPPTVERVVSACLEKDPNLRPASAITVAAALPGSDTLGLAQSAGVTPSPTFVAAASQKRALLNARTTILLSLLPVYLVAFALLAIRVGLPITTANTQPTPVLLAKARELVEQLTGQPPGQYEAYDLLSRSKPDFVFPMGNDPNVPAAQWMLPGESLRFWYRTSPTPLAPNTAVNVLFSRARTTLRDPPRNQPGMLTLILNERGELRGFEQIPPISRTRADDAPIDWSQYLQAAGLDAAMLPTKTPSIMPNIHHDRRYAWQTPPDTQPPQARRIAAASEAGHPVWFTVGAAPDEAIDSTSAKRRNEAIYAILVILTIAAVGAIPLAWYNISHHRSDLYGATKLALFVAAVRFIAWALLSSHASEVASELQLILFAILRVHFESGVIWLFYSALEPYVRRFWPETVVAWNRILKGSFGDPLVARDILIGAALGTCVATVALTDRLLPVWFGIQAREMLRFSYALEPLLGARQGIATLLHTTLAALYLGLLMLIMLVLARMLTKRTWLAIILTMLAMSPMYLPRLANASTSLLPLGAVMLAIIWSATRFGLVVVVTSVLVSRLLMNMPLSFTPDAVGWDLAIFVYLLILALAVYGFIYARRHRPGSEDDPALDTSFFSPSHLQ